MSDLWHPLMTYRGGERCTYLGVRYEAKFDLIRGLRPDSHLAEKFWRRVVTIKPGVKQPAVSRPAVRRDIAHGYIRKVITAD